MLCSLLHSMTTKKIVYPRLSIVIALGLATGLGSAVPLATFAATTPAEPTVSFCVTAETKNLYSGYLTRLDKDIAPYAENANMAKAIASYKTALELSWAAMTEVHCGHGSPGYASATHSFKKTMERAQAAFQTAAKGQKKNTKVAAVTSSESEEKAEPETVAKTETPAVKPTMTAKKLIPHGLHRGQRSTSVQDLQKELLTYFKEKIDTENNATGYFGPLTQELVIRFQLDKKIIASRTSPGAGLVGPKTTAALNALAE